MCCILNHFSGINSLLDFLKLLVVSTASQLVWLLGLFFIFGLVLYLFARLTRNTYVKSVGQKADIFFTGWIGTPVHELGHAVFCVLFRHKIREISLYRPDATDGTLGYVSHSYNPRSTYQRIGNFFIGIGPIIFGSLAIYLAMHFLVQNKADLITGIEAQGQTFVDAVRGEFGGVLSAYWSTTLQTLSGLFTSANFADYRFWIFLYFSICVASHMELSPPDIKGSGGGLLALVLFFLFVNLIVLGLEAVGISDHFGGWWSYVKLESYAVAINKWLGMLASLFVFATIISGLHFVCAYAIFSFYNLLRGRGLINPAW